MKKFLSLILVSFVGFGCNSLSTEKGNNTVVLKSEVEWTYLNPKRKDKAPMAATLWGDRTKAGPTGFLLKPKNGFESPPHIHNVSYQGIVISGEIHNDDPKATNMWMPAGSFWTQPKGEVHITAAKGTNSLAYIEIEEGPYLVLHEEHAFDSGERSVNVDKSNIVWLDAADITWLNQDGDKASPKKPQLAFLWGKPQANQLNGSLIKLPDGFTGTIQSSSSSFKAVVIKGELEYTQSNDDLQSLEPGSLFSSEGKSVHKISSKETESIIYVRTNGKYEVIQSNN